MPQAAYPTAANLSNVLQGLALFDLEDLEDLLTLLSLDAIALAAVRQWEEETGWIPFLADAVSTARRFDPPGPNTRPQITGGDYRLDLRRGTISTAPVVITGFSETDAGTTLAIGTDYWLTPVDANLDGRPFTGIEFALRQWGVRRSVQVTARWGYSATVPDNAWLAILHYGVLLALPEIAANITGGGNVEFQELGVTERFGDAFLTGAGGKDDPGLGGAWMREWSRVVRTFKRIVV